MSGRGGSGSFGSGRTAGYAIGEERTSPWLEAIAGIRSDRIPGWAPSPCRLPGPVTRYVQVSVGFSPPRLQRAPPSERQYYESYYEATTRLLRGYYVATVLRGYYEREATTRPLPGYYEATTRLLPGY